MEGRDGKRCLNLTFSRRSADEDDDIVRRITANEAKNLAHSLRTKILPGLNENERVHLIAMVDTIVEVRQKKKSIKRLLMSSKLRLQTKENHWMKTELDLLLCWKITFI